MVSKEWKSKYNKEWYKKNRVARRQQLELRKKEMIDWYIKYKSTLKCEKCGEDHVACLQFHHKDPHKKDGNLSEGLRRQGWSKERFLKEVEKCIVLCANCHMKHHWEND